MAEHSFVRKINIETAHLMKEVRICLVGLFLSVLFFIPVFAAAVAAALGAFLHFGFVAPQPHLM